MYHQTLARMQGIRSSWMCYEHCADIRSLPLLRDVEGEWPGTLSPAYLRTYKYVHSRAFYNRLMYFYIYLFYHSCVLL